MDQNKFYNGSKCYWLRNDNNGLTSKYTLKNIFVEENTYLNLFIFIINGIIHFQAYKPSKKRYRKNGLLQRKILGRGKGKNIKKFKSCNKCSMKDWYWFEMLVYPAS